MGENTAMVVFQGKKIRRVWHNSQWYFAVTDIVFVLTDSVNPLDYLKKIRKRDETLMKDGGKLSPPFLLKLLADHKTLIVSILNGLSG